MITISPSILTADFTKLGTAIDALTAAGADMLHIDVMDGIFVPNISIGFRVIESIKQNSNLPLDVHLMIDRPARYIERFAASGSDIITIHCEAGSPVRETLEQIRKAGCKSAVSVKPKTPAPDIFDVLDVVDMVLVMSVEPGFGGQAFMPSALSKITELKNEIDRRGLSVDIEVDGGIDLVTAPQVIEAGANVLVAGNSLFSARDMAATMQGLRGVQ